MEPDGNELLPSDEMLVDPDGGPLESAPGLPQDPVDYGPGGALPPPPRGEEEGELLDPEFDDRPPPRRQARTPSGSAPPKPDARESVRELNFN